jgi:F-type H+-transporting ATPase subunit gamma
MNNLREIKGRLRSIRKNRQILSAMKMVSAVKLRRIQAVVQVSRPYAQRLEALVQTLLDLPEGRALQHPLLLRRSVQRILWVVISTDRGLCGSLNTNLFRFVQQALRERAGAKSAMALLLIGRKAGDFFKRAQAKASDFRIEQAYPLAEAQAEMIVRQVCDLYRKGQVDQVDLFYAQCKSTLQQIPAKVPLLPVAPSTRPADGLQKRARLFEPSPGTIADDLLPRYLASRVRQILFEEQVSEHSARMIMMDQASKNASDMIDQIQMDYNTLRQVLITRELADITTGVEAMA